MREQRETGLGGVNLAMSSDIQATENVQSNKIKKAYRARRAAKARDIIEGIATRG